MSAAQMTASRSVFVTEIVPPAADASAKSAVQCVNPLAEAGWDSTLASHPQASFFQSAAWAAVLNDTYGYTPHYFVLRNGGALRALLPLMEVNSWLTGRRGVALPFTDECEPLGDADAVKGLVSNALVLGRARGWKHVELRGGRKYFAEAPASLSFYSHAVDLTADEDALFARVEPAVRRAVRKAEKEGVSVEFSNSLEAVKIFYGLLCRTRKKHGLPPQPFAFFRNIQRRVLEKNLGTVALARHEGKPVAGAVYFTFGRQVIYKFGASDESKLHLRGNNVVMWEAIRRHAKQGCQILHLGRTSLGNEGLRRFKLGWGAREERTEYLKYDLKHDSFLTDRDETSGWHNKVFNRMPIFLSKIIGAALYPHWA